MPPLLLAALLFAPPSAPTFVVRTADGAEHTGRLATLGPDWRLTLADPAVTVPGRDLVSVARTDRGRPAWPTAAGLVLANGDRVSGSVVGGDDLALQFRPSFLPTDAAPWRVPFAAVRLAWYAPPPIDAPPFPDRLAWRPPAGDAVLLRNGDVVRGRLDRLTETGGVRLTADGKPTALDPSAVAAVSFDPALTAARRPKGVHARLVLASGARLTLTAASCDGTTFRGTTAFNARFERPLADVVALDLYGGRVTPLSAIAPTAANTDGFVGVTWPWTADRTVKHHPLTLLGPRGIDTFDAGLGTHPRTVLTFLLAGRHRWFEATVGLDAVTGRRGAAVVRVLVDDVARGEYELTAERPAAVRVDVARAKRLTLAVDYGPAGDVQADVNWADAKLID